MSRSYPDRPFVGIGVVAFKEDCVLLIRRGKPPIPSRWSIPGGAQEIDETVREGALRELREETGIEAEILGLIDVVDSITRDDDGRVKFHYTLVDFAAEWVSGEAIADDDAEDARWVKLTELGDYNLWSETQRIIASAEKMRTPR